MARPSATQTTAPPERTSIPSRAVGDPPVTEDLLVRNYDVERDYIIRVHAEERDTGSIFHWTYYLDPGEFRSEIAVLEPGTYDITVETDSCGSTSTTCEIGPDADQTAMIEAGNLSISATQGVY